MADTYYLISEASKLVHVESHVLRYWEEELGLLINRNELGHRLYSDDDIRLFNVVRILKEKGYQLKAIRELLPHLKNMEERDVETFQDIHFDNVVEPEQPKDEITPVPEEGEEKLEKFEQLLSDIILRALEKYELSHPIQENVPVEISDKSMDALTSRIEEIMNKREEKEEERLRLLDEGIRNCQKLNQEQKRGRIGVFLRSLVS